MGLWGAPGGCCLPPGILTTLSHPALSEREASGRRVWGWGMSCPACLLARELPCPFVFQEQSPKHCEPGVGDSPVSSWLQAGTIPLPSAWAKRH